MMGIRQYLETCSHPTRWKLCALLAVCVHAVVLLGSGFLMTQPAQYGIQAAVAGNGKPVAPRRVEERLQLDLEDQAPTERQIKSLPKPLPKPLVPADGGRGVSGQVAQKPSYYLNPPPSYPMGARERKEEGTVILRAQVDEQGKVASVLLLKSSGFADLDAAALEAVKAWRFKPAQLAGIAVSSSVNIPIRFQLRDIF